MGYVEPYHELDSIIRDTRELASMVEKEYEYVSDTFRDDFLENVKRIDQYLKQLKRDLISHGRAGRKIGRYPNLPPPYEVTGWTAARGEPVWLVGRRDFRFRSAGGSSQPAPGESEVVIYLDQYNPEELLLIQEAAMKLAASLGYEDFSLIEEQKGSIFKRWGAKLHSGLDSDFAHRKLEEADERASLELVGKVRAENDALKTENAVNLIASLSEIPNAVVRVGSILIVKQSSRGSEPIIMVRELSTREIRALERNPGIQRDPQSALEMLSIAVRDIDDEPDRGHYRSERA